MKIFFMVTLVLVVFTGVLFAGGDTDTSSSKKIVIKVGYENQSGSPVDVAAHDWARIVAEKSDGRVELQLFPSSQLGTKKDLTEQMIIGSNVITISDGSFLMNYTPDMGILSGPFLGSSWDEYFNLISSPWFDDQVKKFEKKGLTVLTANWIYGARHLLSTMPVRKPADLKGAKIRCPNNELFIKSIAAMGATPTPMPLGDVYPAISQGVIEGMENPLPVLYNSKIYEKAKFLNMTGHIKLLAMWIGGADFFNSLPPEIVTIIKEAGDEAGLTLNKSIEKFDNQAIEDLKAEGVTVVRDVDIDAFKKAAQSVYSSFKQWSPGLYETVQKNMK